MAHYSDEQKAIGVAALVKWGARPAARWLQQEWGENGDVLSHATLLNWANAGIERTETAVEIIDQVDQQRKLAWHASIDARREATLEAYDEAVENRQYLGMQQAATAVGILHDKLMPPARAGAAVSVGAAGTVQIMIAGPPHTDDANHRDTDGVLTEGD